MMTDDCETWEAEQAKTISELRRERDMFRELHRHALGCVDRVFQECSENPDPILPGFCWAGDDKFEAVVRLATAYKKLEAEVERLHKQLIKDWCDEDEAIRKQALRVLDPKVVEGDTWHVPRMGELAELMADEFEQRCKRLRACFEDVIKQLAAENAKLRGYVTHKWECPSREQSWPTKPCTCGLSELLKGGVGWL